MLTFVGVGPGDPELITLKAVRALRDADEIALADSGSESVVEKIAAEYWQGKAVLRLYMPMTKNKEEWHRAHGEAARILIGHLDAGKRIAYPVLGDPSLYATSSYLLPLISAEHECEVIPGVPAVCALAAACRVPLAEGRESFTILPGLPEGADIPEENVAIMKAGSNIASLRDKAGLREAYVAKNLGMSGEKVAPLRQAGAEWERSYFTTVLVRAGKNGKNTD